MVVPDAVISCASQTSCGTLKQRNMTTQMQVHISAMLTSEENTSHDIGAESMFN